MAWVNGVMLGRYWDIGPQRALYVPAPFLLSGSNTVVVLETDTSASAVEFQPQPDIGVTQF
jgi:beta-galactosidase